jgi:hypothetical protein
MTDVIAPETLDLDALEATVSRLANQHSARVAQLPPLDADLSQGAANEAWLKAHKDHHLYYRWALLYSYDPEYAQTCSEVTACRLAEQFNGTPLEDWRVVDVPQGMPNTRAPVSVVEFGDHWFVLCSGVVYQSVWRRYGPRRGYLNATHIMALTFRDVELFLNGRCGGGGARAEVRQYFPNTSDAVVNKCK